jgi:hypothetical protein
MLKAAEESSEPTAGKPSQALKGDRGSDVPAHGQVTEASSQTSLASSKEGVLRSALDPLVKLYPCVTAVAQIGRAGASADTNQYNR